MSRWGGVALVVGALLLTAGGPSAGADPAAAAAAGTPARAAPPEGAPVHTVVVVLENHSSRQIIANRHARYLNRLADEGAFYRRSYATDHPSQPNYLVLFSGRRHGVRDDSCPHRIVAPNLAGQLLAAGQSFVGYSEGLPRTGWTGCRRGDYVRKHAPWVNFTDLPARASRPLTAFPRDLSALPTVSFVIPDLRHDMHDGSIRSADRWLRRNVKRYADWAVDNDSLLIVTFDEDDRSQHNRIPTIAYGAAVRTGTLGRRIDHCSVLRTLESLYRLRPLGCAATTAPVRSLWRR